MTDNAFKINDTLISSQPSKHGWEERGELGIDGNGRAIYPAIRAYSLEWDALSASEFNSIYAYYLLIGSTGTVSIDLPEWAASSYQFRTYSGCILKELRYDEYFENFYLGVKLSVTRIRTV